MKVVSELYKLIKRVDKLTETIEALEKENKALREELEVYKATTESKLIDIEAEIEAINNYNFDVINRIEELEITGNVRRERRKK